ncbi:hypothetical protein B0H13DRAFT_2662385 [Mycena leptocephala]|nr:hypothetical protein B0H13DRAFT_2662385 [Mycena leptocephala]
MAIGQISSVFPPGRNSLEDEKLVWYSWSSSWFWGGFRYEYMHNRYRDHGRPSLRKQYMRSRSKYAAIARKHVDELFARQSSTLKQAEGRYKLKNDRDPPPEYHSFYEFAQQMAVSWMNMTKHAYSFPVHRDFEPFYQLAEHHPTFFPDMLERAMRIADDDGGLCLTTFNIKNPKSPADPIGHQSTGSPSLTRWPPCYPTWA